MLSSIHGNRRMASPSATRMRSSWSNRNIEVSGRFAANVRYNEPAWSNWFVLLPLSPSLLPNSIASQEPSVEEVQVAGAGGSTRLFLPCREQYHTDIRNL